MGQVQSSEVFISRSALNHNIAFFRKLVGPKTKFMAVVKSNAYGHGLIPTASIALNSGADLLGVNAVEEALELRSQFPKATIMVMGSIPNLFERLNQLNDENFWILVSRLEEIKALAHLNPRPKIHLKVDTGMSRLGTSLDGIEELAKEIFGSKLPLDGIATHFASTEDFTEHSYSMKQLEKFESAIQIFKKNGFLDLVCHCASSASAMLFSEARKDMVRVGISLYGLWPSLETKLSLSLMKKEIGSLRPALTWKTKIQHIQHLPQGSFVGYGSTYKTTFPTVLAVVPVGYYEGLDRKLSNQGYMLVNGERAKILGRICMNMTMLDITNIPNAKLGEEVIILGQSGEESITADDHATWTNTINYEIVTKILNLFPRTIVD